MIRKPKFTPPLAVLSKSACGTFRTGRDVCLESVMRSQADVDKLLPTSIEAIEANSRSDQRFVSTNRN